VVEFCSCGAQLPDEARFCHKCGKPQFDYDAMLAETRTLPPAVEPQAAIAVPEVPLEIGFHNRIAVRIAFIGAINSLLLFFLLQPIPLLAIFGSFLLAGFLAVYLYRRATGQNVTAGNGAKIGWITGVFSFTIFTLLSTCNVLFMSYQGGMSKILDQFRSQMSAQGADADMLLRLIDQPMGLAAFLLGTLIFMFVFLTLLPTLGGALGAKLFTRAR
jgi:zinc-ribbon domain